MTETACAGMTETACAGMTETACAGMTETAFKANKQDTEINSARLLRASQ